MIKITIMTCQHCCGAEKIFDEKGAIKQLKRYRKKGPRKTSRLLIEGLKRESSNALSILDIGAGIGAVHLEMIKHGISKATDVDASPSYLNKAKEEAKRQGELEKVTYLEGDYLDQDENIESHDIVVMDKVICCYPHMDELVRSAAEKSNKLLALVYPKNNLMGKAIINFGNAYCWITKNPFRVFLHGQ